MDFKSKPAASRRILAIIVNWNKKEFLRNLLASLRTIGGTPFDTVVVDNASSDGSPAMVREEFPEVTLLETGANLGGTGGFNAGMTYGLLHERQYEFLWLMDNDIVVHPGALDALIDAMESDAKIALAGSAILVLGDNERVQEIGASVRWHDCALVRSGEGLYRDLNRPTVFDVDYVAACSLLARVEAVRDVGIWDPGYFVFWDDVEWGVRFKQKGYRVVATTESRVEHDHFDNRRSRQNHVMTYLVHRNAVYFFLRHSPPEHRAAAVRHIVRVLYSMADCHAATGRMREAKVIEAALRDGLELRMGPPPDSVRKLAETPEGGGENPGQLIKRAKRIAFFASDSAELTVKQLDAVRNAFPSAECDVLMLDPQPLLADSPVFDRRRILSSRTLQRRFSLFLKLAAQYDAIAMPSTVPAMFSLSLAATRITVGDDLSLRVYPRKPAAALGFIGRRLRTTIRARSDAARAARTPLPPVNYHPFVK